MLFQKRNDFFMLVGGVRGGGGRGYNYTFEFTAFNTLWPHNAIKLDYEGIYFQICLQILKGIMDETLYKNMMRA
jgi:hypothetical protein